MESQQSKIYPLDPKGNIQSSIWQNTSLRTGRQYLIIKFSKGYENGFGKFVNCSLRLDTREIYFLKAAVDAVIQKLSRIQARSSIIISQEGEVNFMDIKLTGEDSNGKPWQRHEKCVCCHELFNYSGPHRNPCVCDKCLKRMEVEIGTAVQA